MEACAPDFTGVTADCMQTAALLNGTDFNGDNVTDYALCIDTDPGKGSFRVTHLFDRRALRAKALTQTLCS